jgi:hypothetical protein
MSGGTQTTTQKSEPWVEQRPYLHDIFRQAQALYDQPGPSYYPGQTVAPFSPETELALNARAARAQAGSPLDALAAGSLADTLSGRYFGANPYLDHAIDQASRGVTRNYRSAIEPGIDSSFSGAGRYGSGLHQAAQSDARQTLSSQLGDISGGLAYRAYDDERANMLRAAALAPQIAQQDYQDIAQLASVGNDRERLMQDLINADAARYNHYQQLPYDKLGQYLGFIQGDYGGTATTRAPSGRSFGGDFLSGAQTGAQLGSPFGPSGAGIGSVLGGIISLF